MAKHPKLVEIVAIYLRPREPHGHWVQSKKLFLSTAESFAVRQTVVARHYPR